MIKNILLLFIIISGTKVLAQSNSSIAPTPELYGYYKKGQNFETIQPKIKQFEAALLEQGITFLRVSKHSDNDYKLFFSQKFGSQELMKVTVRYQFLIPFFKISLEDARIIYPGGEVTQITKNSGIPVIRELYDRIYKTYVLTLVKLIDPAKIRTKEEIDNAIKN